MSDSLRSLQLQAEALAAPLPPLLVEAFRVAASVVQGVHGRRRSGPGENFWQFRRYQPGDSAGAVDWRQSAKSDALYVRETEWSAAQTVLIWPDPSASMRWQSAPHLPEKRDRAVLLALALAVLLVAGGERVGLLGDQTGPITGHLLLPRLAAALLAQPPSAGVPQALLPRQAHVILLSDFLVDLDVLETQLRPWAGVRGHLVHLLDPAELSLPYEGRLRFTGLEGEGDYLAPKAESLRAAYTERLADHRRRLGILANGLGWSVLDHQTDAPPHRLLTALHSALSGR
ncbi:DUF58 domain-containing protein [Telmatospirillum sp.]|uniref:DUF58 domain-containing protein n=1 Tax=Telmatospirillum sp. TaxID=2079197 RepID=UPI00284AA8B5|nr:DUF58 domain-containing protein [Telmatospirillum sp.]MDR3437215.1 DUF58 domain-containing protein [Telmatospirillum sp.]